MGTSHTHQKTSAPRDPCPPAIVHPDFSQLPDNVWVTILQMASVKDRYHLSLTCCRLHSLFAVPAVWRNATLYFGRYSFHRSNQIQQVHLCKTFGRFFQNVILKFDDFSLDPESLAVLAELSSVWNLKSFVISIGIPVKESVFNRKYEVLLRSLDFNRMSQQLTRFVFIVPPVTEIINDLAFWGFESVSKLLPGTVNLFPRLGSVMLGCPIVFEKKTDDLRLPAPLTSSLLSLFPRLQHLELSAFNFCDDLLQQLAHTFRSKGQLRRLVVDVFAFNTSSLLPTLSTDAWWELLSACPEVEVSCVLRCPLAERPAHLKSLFPQEAEVPLVSVTVETWRQQTEKELMQAIEIAKQHPQSLHTFVTDFQGLDEEFENAIASLAIDCIHLRNLVYSGEIHYQQVMKIASLNRQWRSLEFYRGRIITEEAQRVCHTVDKEILYKWSRRIDDDIAKTESRKAKLDEMSSLVSVCLQCPWKPIVHLRKVGTGVYR